jgi:hypothetical protein
MVLLLTRLHLAASPVVWRQRLLALLTVTGWLLLAALIALFYVGHSPSPYGACAAPNGRMVACTLLHR